MVLGLMSKILANSGFFLYILSLNIKFRMEIIGNKFIPIDIEYWM